MKGSLQNKLLPCFFSSRSTISANLKRVGIPLRSEDVARKMNKGQMGYGEKLHGGNTIVYQREVAVIEKMKALREQGYSYWKDADILNTMKIPTKTRRAKWQAATVMKILKAAP